MTIDNEVQMAATDPHQYLQCSLLRTQAAGLHVRGIVRAAWEDIRNKAVVEGGSTITQQYVKNAYSRNDKTIAARHPLGFGHFFPCFFGVLFGSHQFMPTLDYSERRSTTRSPSRRRPGEQHGEPRLPTDPPH